jgi:hypothetical protein
MATAGEFVGKAMPLEASGDGVEAGGTTQETGAGEL